MKIKLFAEMDLTDISGTLTLLNTEKIYGNDLISFSANTDTWENMNAEDGKCNENGFIFQVNRDIDCHYRLQFKLDMTATHQTGTKYDTILFSVPIGNMSVLPHTDVQDHRLTFDPNNSSTPSIVLGPNGYGVVWEDSLPEPGIYFLSFDRFFNQKVGPRKIASPCILVNPDIIYNFERHTFVSSYSCGTISLADIDRYGNANLYNTALNGESPKMAWNSVESKIGILYKNGYNLIFFEVEDYPPFSRTHGPIYIYNSSQFSYDITYDRINNRYFIAFSSYYSPEYRYYVYYTTYSKSEEFPPNCPVGWCKIANAKNPKISIKFDPEPVEYALVWEDDTFNMQGCTSNNQNHNVHLRLLDKDLNIINEDIILSNTSDNFASAFPAVFWSESGKKWIFYWIENTCIRGPDGEYREAIWLANINANDPFLTVNRTSEPISNDILGVLNIPWGIEGGFDGERVYYIWADRRIEPRSYTYEIFSNHSFLAHPNSYVPSQNETTLSNPNIGYTDIKTASDGTNFFASFIKNENNENHLEFSLYDENLNIINNMERVQIDTDGGVSFHTVLWDKANKEYNVLWYQDLNNFYKEEEMHLTIPDPGYVESTIGVFEDEVIDYIEVLINIEHPEDGDLTISLIGPNDTEVILSQKNGAGGANYCYTRFFDAASYSNLKWNSPLLG